MDGIAAVVAVGVVFHVATGHVTARGTTAAVTKTIAIRIGVVRVAIRRVFVDVSITIVVRIIADLGAARIRCRI